MRFIGKLKTWNDDRGFGFITPAEGGQEIFVHVSELPYGFTPSPHTPLTFELSLNPQGKKKAVKVQLATVPAVSARLERLSDRPLPESPSGGGFTKLILALVIAGSGWAAYTRYMGPGPPFVLPGFQGQQSRSAAIAQPVAPVQSFSCDGRQHCSQMSSCAEATFFLKNCPGTKMDGDHDGIPCEEQHCRQ